MAKLQIAYGSNGKYEYANLFMSSLQPHLALDEGVTVDYVDADWDGMLESILIKK